VSKPRQKIFGKKFAAMRKRPSGYLTQQELASALGWSIGSIRRVEGAEIAGIELRNFRDLAAYLKMDVETLREQIGAPDDAPSDEGFAEQGIADNGKPPEPAPTISQIDVDGMSRVDLARRALEILKRLRDMADTEPAKQRFRGAILSCERIIQSNENQRKKQERKAKGA